MAEFHTLDGHSIRPRASGGYISTIEDGWTPRGTRKRISVTGHTEAECRRKLRDLLRARMAGKTTSDPRLTVKQWCDTWTAGARVRLRPGTQQTDEGWIRRWIVPAIGNVRVSSLTPGDLRKIDQAMRAKGLSPTTIRRVRELTHTILAAAVREDHTVPEAVLVATKPRSATNHRAAMPVEVAVDLIRTAAAKSQWPERPALIRKPAEGWRENHVARAQWRLAEEQDVSRWVVALMEGIRQGEALGLEWSRVDLDAAVADVSWQLQAIPSSATIPPDYEVRPLSGQYALVRPKTAAGMRVVPLVPLAVASLRDWRERTGGEGLVWSRRITRQPWRKADDMAAWLGLQSVAGAPMSPDGDPWKIHECRHTTVSLLLASGASAAVIMQIVGHSAWASSQRYAHVDLTQAREALEGMSRLMLPAGSGLPTS